MQRRPGNQTPSMLRLLTANRSSRNGEKAGAVLEAVPLVKPVGLPAVMSRIQFEPAAASLAGNAGERLQ
jgi:hypothetical protein